MIIEVKKFKIHVPIDVIFSFSLITELKGTPENNKLKKIMTEKDIYKLLFYQYCLARTLSI